MSDKACPRCGGAVIGRSDKRYCSERCRVAAARDAATEMCVVDDCPKIVRSRGASVCQMHYFRLRRGGSIHRRHEPTGRFVTPRGYVLVAAHGHPLAQSDGWVYEHRLALYERIGPGSHQCRWCERVVTWDKEWPTDGDALVVDHLNDRRDDNRIENLSPSCGPCNWARSVSFAPGTTTDAR